MTNKKKYKFSSDWIHKLENERHWQYYHAQQAFLENRISKEESLLEVGIGTSFTSNYLKSKHYNIRTMDIDANKKPDTVANIVTDTIPGPVDALLAFEVFEHIPYQEFLISIDKMKKHEIKKVFLSIPYNEKVWFDIDLRIHVLGRFWFQIATRRNRLTTDHHQWEIKYKKHSLRKIKKDIEERGYKIVADQRKFSQRFFYLPLQ